MKALRSLSAIRTAVPKRCATRLPLLTQRRRARVDTAKNAATAATVKNRIWSRGACPGCCGPPPLAERPCVMAAPSLSKAGDEFIDRLDWNEPPAPDRHRLELAGVDQLVKRGAADPELIDRLLDRQQARQCFRTTAFLQIWH